VKGWAKVLAYAYDVTVLMGNRPDNIQPIFSDYECFIQMSLENSGDLGPWLKEGSSFSSLPIDFCLCRVKTWHLKNSLSPLLHLASRTPKQV